MCGIVGIIGSEPAAPRLIEGLKRLEYRGYDSAGVATLEDGRLTRVRAEGKLYNLEHKLHTQLLSGHSGIAHTRWATHGEPTEENAHPHMTGRLALVHNGIIENFAELKAELEAEGVVFESSTDTEVVAKLIDAAIETARPEAWQKRPERVVYRVLQRLRGAFALLIIFEGREDLMIAARRGSPVAVGWGDGEMFVGSDALALAPFTNRVQYLQDGDIAVVRRDHAEIFWDDHGDSTIPKPIGRPIVRINTKELLVDKAGYSHYMQKEIYEQPDVVGRTLSRYVDFASGAVTLPKAVSEIDWKAPNRVVILACGTSNFAGQVAKHWLEEYAGLHADVEIASEFRYRPQPLAAHDVAIIVSQSGETADTKEAMLLAQQHGLTAVAIVNVESSSIAREAQAVLPIKAGTEVGVASTKAFTCQLAAFAVLTLAVGQARGVMTSERRDALIRELALIPGILGQIYTLEEDLVTVADKVAEAKHALYLGRGVNYPLALEGALKLKEISYVHAEGYAAGEMKHGPIALIDQDMPVIVVAPHDALFEKTISNMQEVAARKGKIVLLTDRVGAQLVGKTPTLGTLVLPEMPRFVAPFAYAMVLQLLAYHTAVRLGRDIDQPRNLAKSVTVE